MLAHPMLPTAYSCVSGPLSHLCQAQQEAPEKGHSSAHPGEWGARVPVAKAMGVGRHLPAWVSHPGRLPVAGTPAQPGRNSLQRIGSPEQGEDLPAGWHSHQEGQCDSGVGAAWSQDMWGLILRPGQSLKAEWGQQGVMNRLTDIAG